MTISLSFAELTVDRSDETLVFLEWVLKTSSARDIRIVRNNPLPTSMHW